MNETRLNTIAREVFASLRSDCPALPDASFTVHYDHNITGNTLAYTSTWFYNALPIVQDVYYVGHDFEIAMHPNATWWDGVCSQLPNNAYDVRTTLLHEFLHGVGIISTVRADKTALPVVYDLQLRDSSDHPVVEGHLFTGTFGQSLHVNHVAVYNPFTYSSGSSFSHYLHSGIMDYAQHTSECIRHIDNDVKRMLQAVGYNCSLTVSGTDMGGLTVVMGLVGLVIVAAVVAGFACRANRVTRRTRR